MSINRPDERDLEEAADRLLCESPRDPERPAYTERHLVRRTRLDAPIEALAETIAPPGRSLRDELIFLLSVSRINQDSRRCLRLWVDGWSQDEIAEAIGTSQQRVSQRLRSALAACYDASPISFEKFSEHAVYRPPRHGDRRNGLLRCARCGDVIDTTRVRGRYCSACRALLIGRRPARTAWNTRRPATTADGNMSRLPDTDGGEDS